MKRLLLAIVFGAMTLHAQVDSLEGLWQGYDGEWGHVSRQLVALAEKLIAYARMNGIVPPWSEGSGK